MRTFKITMTNYGESAGSQDLEIEADNLVQAVFIAGAHWAGNVATTPLALIFGAKGELDHYLPTLEDGSSTVTAEEV